MKIVQRFTPMRSSRRKLSARVWNSLLHLGHFFYWKPQLNHFGWKSRIQKVDLLTNPRQISVGRRVRIWKGSRLETFYLHQGNNVKLRIGDDTSIHMYFHCGAVQSVTIGRSVLIGGRVYISDHDHCYDDPTNPAASSPTLLVSPVVIEDGVWIGEGAVVLKGVTVGERSVIGANSVVTRDVPPFSVAAGSPARVIKRIAQ